MSARPAHRRGRASWGSCLQARTPAATRGKGGRLPAPALVPRARGYLRRLTCAGRAGNGVATGPAAAGQAGLVAGAGIGAVVLEFAQRAERDYDRAGGRSPATGHSRLSPSPRPEPATRPRPPTPPLPALLWPARCPRWRARVGDAHQHLPAVGP